jgi:type II secretory pathway component PulF
LSKAIGELVKNLNVPSIRVFTWFAAIVAASSIACAIVFARLTSTYQEIFNDINAPLPLLTQFFIYSSPWLWLGAVFSFIVWLFVRRRWLSQDKGWIILGVIEFCTIAYAILFPYLINGTMFDIFDRLG